MIHKRGTSEKNISLEGLNRFHRALTSPLVQMWIKTHRCLVCMKNRKIRVCLWTIFFKILYFQNDICWIYSATSSVNFVCYFFTATVSNTTPLEMWEVLFTTKAGVGFVAGSAFITGWLLDIILIIIVICSMPFVRRSGHFQVRGLWFTHLETLIRSEATFCHCSTKR